MSSASQPTVQFPPLPQAVSDAAHTLFNHLGSICPTHPAVLAVPPENNAAVSYLTRLGCPSSAKLLTQALERPSLQTAKGGMGSTVSPAPQPPIQQTYADDIPLWIIEARRAFEHFALLLYRYGPEIMQGFESRSLPQMMAPFIKALMVTGVFALQHDFCHPSIRRTSKIATLGWLAWGVPRELRQARNRITEIVYYPSVEPGVKGLIPLILCSLALCLSAIQSPRELSTRDWAKLLLALSATTLYPSFSWAALALPFAEAALSPSIRIQPVLEAQEEQKAPQNQEEQKAKQKTQAVISIGATGILVLMLPTLIAFVSTTYSNPEVFIAVAIFLWILAKT